MRNLLAVGIACFVSLSLGCGRHSRSGVDQAGNGGSVDDSGFTNDSGTNSDGGADGGTELPPDGGSDGEVSSSQATFSLSANPYTHGGATKIDEPTEEASICCTTTTIISCQTPRGGGAYFSPARRLAVLGAGTGRVSVDIFSDANCQNLVRTLSGTLNFPEPDLWAVNVDFTPPLRTGTQISMKWTAGYCDPTACIPYTLGSTPGGCWED